MFIEIILSVEVLLIIALAVYQIFDLRSAINCALQRRVALSNYYIQNSPSPYVSDLEKRFNELAKNWKKETGAYSTSLHIAGNNNYLEIIGMGNEVVPYILKELQKEPNLWFIALKSITRQNPIQKEHIGKIKLMAEDWIAWGKKNNLI
jgi:hypothetical protein